MGKVQYMTPEEKSVLIELEDWVRTDLMTWPEWHGLQKFDKYEQGFLFNTEDGDYRFTKSVALSTHLPSTYIFTVGRLSFNSNDPIYAHIIPFCWRMNHSKNIYQFESAVGEDKYPSATKLITDKDILPWCKEQMKKIATEFDKGYNFILSYEDKFVEWNNMLQNARKYFTKIEQEFNAELRANGDFQ